MTISKIYTYLGENGIITSPVLLDVYHVTKLLLVADEDKMLTKDGENFVKSIEIPEKELDLWSEV